MPVSSAKAVSLEGGDEVVIAAGPCVITSVVLTEMTGGAPGGVGLAGAGGSPLMMTLGVGAGQTVVWAGEPLAAGAGVKVSCGYGDVAVMVAYR